MANEKRLIDAVRFRETLDRYANAPHVTLLNNYSRCMRMAIETCMEFLDMQRAVDAVPVDDIKEFAKDVVYQFGYYGQYNGRLHIGHGGLSTLEWAFDILGWDNPHPAPEFECEIEGCHEHATCGAPTSDGYKRMCGKHFAERRTNERKAD